MPEISIIVPVYKVEQYLPRCIDSILAQTFTDFELILVDDGSPDNCGKICDEYAEKDARIRVIHQANAGVSAARNAGLNIAIGTYIMFCDSDDYVATEWCASLYEAISQNDVAMAVCGYHTVVNEKILNNLKSYCGKEKIQLRDLFEISFNGAPWNKIYINSQIKKFHITFPSNVSFGEDARFIYNYLATFIGTDYIYLSKAKEYFYVEVSGSLSKSYIENFWKLECELVDLIIKVSINHGADLSKYQNNVADKYYAVVFQSMNNIFHSNNQSSNSTKYKELKEILRSEEFNKSQKSKFYNDFPAWYKTLLNLRATPLIFLYRIYSSKLKRKSSPTI